MTKNIQYLGIRLKQNTSASQFSVYSLFWLSTNWRMHLAIIQRVL